MTQIENFMCLQPELGGAPIRTGAPIVEDSLSSPTNRETTTSVKSSVQQKAFRIFNKILIRTILIGKPKEKRSKRRPSDKTNPLARS